MNYLALAALLIALAYGRICRKQVREARVAREFWMDTAIRFEAENHRLRGMKDEGVES